MLLMKESFYNLFMEILILVIEFLNFFFEFGEEFCCRMEYFLEFLFEIS